jgi:putative ABC transport system permease protein
MDNIADPAAKVIEIGERMSLALGPEYSVDSLKAYLLKASFQGIGFFGSFIYVFSIIFPAIAGIMVASILNLSVEEKTQDLAVLRLLGAKRIFVAKVIFIELLIMLAIGLPTGVFFGMFLSLAIVGRFFTGTTLTIVGATVLLQVITTLIVLLLFSLKPILKAFKTNPIDAVRRVKKLGVFKFVSTQGIDRRIFLGSLIFFLALVYSTMIIPSVLIFSSPGNIITFIIMSILFMLVSLCVTLLGAITYVEEFIVRLLCPFSKRVSKLISNNIRRYSRRNLSTNMIFGIIVAIMIFFSTFISAIQVSAEDNVRYANGSDIRVSSLMPMSMFRVEQIESITGVDQASPVTSGVGASLANLVGPSGSWINLYGIYPDLATVNYVSDSDFHKGDVGSFEELTNSSIIITRQLADDLEVDMGDRVILEYEENRFYVTITAILKSMPGYIAQVSETWGGTQACFVSIELYAFITSQQQSDLGYNDVFVKVEKGFDHEEVGRNIKNEFAAIEGIGVSVTEVGIRMTVEGTSILQLIFMIILTSLLLVAIFSLITNLYASIIEREYEIGVLKALGFRKSDILRSLLIEGLVIALASVLIGLIAGIAVGFMVIYWLNLLSPVNLIFWIPEFVVIYLLIASIVSSILATYFTTNSVAKKPIINLMRRIE